MEESTGITIKSKSKPRLVETGGFCNQTNRSYSICTGKVVERIIRLQPIGENKSDAGSVRIGDKAIED